MYICKQSQVGGGWGGGGVVDVSCGTMIILHFSRHRPRFARDRGWLAGGVGWWMSAVGPSSLQPAQKILENYISKMGVKVLGGWWVGWGWGGRNQLWDHHHCVGLEKS